MIGPTWLAAIFGVIMIVAAVVALVRIIAALATRKATDFEVDAHNVVMGVSMAGMLIPPLLIVTTGPSTTVWLVVWILITAWFAISVVRDAVRSQAGRRFTGHHLPHLVMSGAMIYMFSVIGTGAGMAGSSMAGMSAGGLVPLPTLDYVFVIFLIGYAVLVVDRLPVIALVGSGDLQAIGHGGAASSPSAVPLAPLAPRLAAATNIVMAITMGYMLTMMFV